MPSSSDGKARARVQSVDSGVESVVVPVLLQQQVVLQGLTAALKELHDDVATQKAELSATAAGLAKTGRASPPVGAPPRRQSYDRKGSVRGDHRPTL